MIHKTNYNSRGPQESLISQQRHSQES